MKILYIHGDDYAALQFEQRYSGTPVVDVINNLSDYQSSEENEEYWELDVTEIEGVVSKSFIDYVKNKMDYDDTKHVMWYHEMETI